MPVVASPAIARAAGPSGIVPLHVENSVITGKIVATTRYFPSVDGDVVVADLPTWLDRREHGRARRRDRIGALARRAAAPPPGVCRSTSPRSARASAELTSDPLARGAIALLLVTALVGLALAAVGLAADRRRRPARRARRALRPRGAGRDSGRPPPARPAARGGRRRASALAGGRRRGRDRRRARRRRRHRDRRRRRTRCRRLRSRSTGRSSLLALARARRRARAARRDRGGAEGSGERRRGPRSLPPLRDARGDRRSRCRA